MKLDELLNVLEVIDKINPVDNIEIKGIANHTNDIEKGYIYVAIKGYITDGHKYIDEAIKKGAKAIIVEEFNKDISIPQYKVSNTRKSLSAISDKFYNHPSKSMRIIGVTATNGKTTTTYMLDSILEKANIMTGMIGSVVTKAGDEIIPSVLTTPESVDLQRSFHHMKNIGIEKVAMEVSSSALELNRVDHVDFDILALNNISREHIDQHGSFENYWNIKSGFIKGAKEDSYVVLNLDDEYSRSLIGKTRGKLITYSLKGEKGNLYCKDLDLKTGRGNFIVKINQPFKNINGEEINGEFKISLGIPGYHSVANAMSAITIALIEGISIMDIQNGLEDFQGVERRFQYIYEDDFIIVDDHFANKGNINVTFETLKHMNYNKLHLVYAIRGSRGVTVNRENAETIVEWKDKLGIKEIIGTKSIGDTREKDKVRQGEEKIFKEVMEDGNIETVIYDSLNECVDHVLNEVEDNDIILLAGCQGMDHGGKLILEELKKRRPELNEEELFKPIRHRIV